MPDLKPHMSKDEIELYSRQLRYCERLLEFGCGGSTKLAVDLGVPSIDSVESDKSWLDILRNHPDLARNISEGSLRLHHADIGPVREWGSPKNRAHATRWPGYYGAIWKHLASAPDLVLVDGRWRVACTIRAIFECPATTKIVIHDFWERPHYHIVLGFLDTLERAGTMGVFRKRDILDWPALCRVADQYGFDHR